MKEFIGKYENRIHGVLSCFDRMLFRGYLPITSGWKMAELLYRLHIHFGNIKPFLLQNSERVKNHAVAMAQKQGRPFQYLPVEYRQGGYSAPTGPTRRNPPRPGLYFFDFGTLPWLFVSVQETTSRPAPFRQTRTAEMFAFVLLLHGSSTRLDPRTHSNVVSDADSGLCERAMNGSPGSWKPMTLAIPSARMSFSGSRTSLGRSASPIDSPIRTGPRF